MCKLFQSLKLYTEGVVWGMDSGFAFKSKLYTSFIPLASHVFFAGAPLFFVLLRWCLFSTLLPQVLEGSNGFYNNLQQVPSQVPWMTLAKPMSVNLTRPWSVNNKFSGFKSRKTILTAYVASPYGWLVDGGFRWLDLSGKGGWGISGKKIEYNITLTNCQPICLIMKYCNFWHHDDIDLGNSLKILNLTWFFRPFWAGFPY